MTTEPAPTAMVIGGGPAGLMAAEVLSEAGCRVSVYEHMASVGRKLLLAGRSGLNLTHDEPLDGFLARYGSRRAELEQALTAFGPIDLRTWCAARGMPTYAGTSGRVFPDTFTGAALLRSWLIRLESLGVNVHVRHRWLGFVEYEAGDEARTGSRFATPSGEVHVEADATVMALGGASWPRVGSDGAWVDQFARQGIGVLPLRPANCGVVTRWTEVFVKRFGGEPIKNVAMRVADEVVRGDVVVTANGLEGGPVYAHSGAIRAELDRHGVMIAYFDLQPDLGARALADRLTQRRRAKDSVSTWLRRAGFAPASVALLREATENQVPTDATELATLVKATPIAIVDLAPIDKAISTAGGVSFDEIDERFMLRRRPGVFVAGEMLDWEAPTGGYLLQGSFSTGVAAARGALAWLQR
ncbi:MAG: NAD(P)/FAD-dependent oxidoreductase [Acidimicrobiales bacterium]